jgi:hypothetical protein
VGFVYLNEFGWANIKEDKKSYCTKLTVNKQKSSFCILQILPPRLIWRRHKHQQSQHQQEALSLQRMKIFTFILSFYILFLSAVPCCAFDNCKDEAQRTQKANQHEHNDGCKNCSPFNQCGNCVGFTFSSNAFQVHKPQQLTQQKSSVITQSITSKYFSSFWQPPRLS